MGASQGLRLGSQNGKTGRGCCADVKIMPPPLGGMGEGGDRTCSESTGGLEAEPGSSQVLELARPPLSTPAPPTQSQELLSQPLTCPAMPSPHPRESALCFESHSWIWKEASTPARRGNEFLKGQTTESHRCSQPI